MVGRSAISRQPGSVASALAPPRQASIRRDDSTISAQGIGTPADSSGGCHADVAKAVLDTQAANEVFRSGAPSEALDRIQEAQPEALYSFVEDGQRAFFAVFDLVDPSQIPVISEPLYQRANVKLTLTPCMTLEDAKKGLEEAARQMPAMQG